MKTVSVAEAVALIPDRATLMIGGFMARSQSTAVIVAVAVVCGILGWFFGADYKRRMNRPRDRQDNVARPSWP